MELKTECGWCFSKLKATHNYESYGSMCMECNEEISFIEKNLGRRKKMARVVSLLALAERLKVNGKPSMYEKLQEMTLGELIESNRDSSYAEENKKARRETETEYTDEVKRQDRMSQLENDPTKFWCVKCDRVCRRAYAHETKSQGVTA